MVAAHEKVILRKVDIVKWESEAAQQADREFSLAGIPHVRVFDRGGGLVADVHGNDPAGVETAVKRALGP